MTDDQNDDVDIPYADAVRELDQILDELDGDNVDIDDLARQVRRAATLIRLCRTRISDARTEVREIVAELAPDDTDDLPATD